MIQLIDSNWRSHFIARANERHETLRIVCPFIKRNAVQRLIAEGHQPEIRVITRFNLADFAAGVSDIDALRWLLDRGAAIRGIRGLHAKMYLFGDHQVTITSANLTEAALTNNHEFGFVSSEPAIAENSHAYFERLWRVAGSNLTYEQLNAWAATLEAAARSASQSPPQPTLPDAGTVVALVSSALPTGSNPFAFAPAPLPIPPSSEPSLYSEASQAFVKFLGVSNDRAPVTKLVYDELVDSGCHRLCGYPKGKRPQIVETGAVQFFARMMDDGDMMIFGRAIAIQHDPASDDASTSEIAEWEWLEKWPHIIRVHSGQYLSGTLENGVRLSELMNELGPTSFATTKERARSGETGIVLSQTYARQPYVRLSEEGLQWLNERLERAFQLHGTQAPEDLRSLNW